MPGPPRTDDPTPHRAGISRRAMLGAIIGTGTTCAAATWWLFRMERGPAPSELIPVDPTESTLRTPEEPAFIHPPVPASEPIVRVRVHRVRDDDGEVIVGSDGQWVRLITEDRDGDITYAGPAMRGPLRVRMGTSGWSISDRLGFRSPIGGASSFIVALDVEQDEMEHSGDLPPMLSIGSRRYPDRLRFVHRSNLGPSAFDVINDVALESYLPGVVSRELYNHWHEQTHAAQAIAARSFACAEHAYFRDRRHFDLTDTQSSQVYEGATTHERSIEAVQDTYGQVLAFEGLLVPGYYSSCCGGTAATASDTIGPNPINAIHPLRGQSEKDICRSAPVCVWQTQRPIDVTTRRIVAWAKRRGHADVAELDELRAIEPVSHNAHGRPKRYAITDINGTTVELPAERVRQALNYAELGLYTPTRQVRSSHFTATRKGDSLHLEGFGFGHGVGMCQHGAQIRARNGASYDDILKWYYPDVEIVTAYDRQSADS